MQPHVELRRVERTEVKRRAAERAELVDEELARDAGTARGLKHGRAAYLDWLCIGAGARIEWLCIGADASRANDEWLRCAAKHMELDRDSTERQTTRFGGLVAGACDPGIRADPDEVANVNLRQVGTWVAELQPMTAWRACSR